MLKDSEKTNKMSQLFILAILFVSSMTPITSMAANRITVQPMSVNIYEARPTISISGNRAIIKAVVQGESGTSLTGTLSLHRTMNGTWTTLRNFPLSGTGSIITSESVYLSVKGEYRVRLYVRTDGDSKTAYAYATYR